MDIVTLCAVLTLVLGVIAWIYSLIKDWLNSRDRISTDIDKIKTDISTSTYKVQTISNEQKSIEQKFVELIKEQKETQERLRNIEINIAQMKTILEIKNGAHSG